MAIRAVSTVFLSLSVVLAFGQPAKPSAVRAGKRAPIVQPGAPGKAAKTLPAAAVAARVRVPAEADVGFMQGMIHHHAQAVEMVDLLRTRGQRKDLLAFGERITISQSDEIQFMKQWLEERGRPVAPAHNHAGHMAAGMPLMPGMLTAEQMSALAKAKGAEFDRLFLTGMIQHHIGALVMVDELFDTPGAGQDPVLYDFATDIDNTQRAEIGIMRGMLKESR
ncbi:MAG: DUF305 domain-containing protein [Acidobacteria bacterium]|nr:DUF305 domain-containing protein [Acidobacteriota bacterium]